MSSGGLADLLALRAQLNGEPPADDASTIVAIRVPGQNCYHLGLTHAGQLCALVETKGQRPGVDVRLRNLEVRQGVRCRIRVPGAAEHNVTGSLVTCCAEQPALQDLFVRLYAEAIDELGPEPATSDVANWLQRLADLLSRLEQEGRKRLQGLWAELLVIREFGAPELLVRRWRADPHERFDFLASAFALEVKSCQDFERVHEFSLEQLRPPAGLESWVVSAVLRRDPMGLSVLDLLKDIEGRLTDPALRQLLRELTLTTAGSALDEDDHHRFDAQLACANLRLLDTRAIPCVSGDPPAEVIRVSLRVRCEAVPQIGSPQAALLRLGAP